MTEAATHGKGDPRDRIIDALMALAAIRDWRDIELSDIATQAGVSLAQLRAAYPSKGAILGAFARRIDLAVLEGTTDDMAQESARDRLFDVLMRRIDHLTPYKAALERIKPAILADPAAAAAMNGVALNTHRFMLAAAGISTEDALAPLKLQGLVIAFNRVLDTWFDDDDAGLARTMAKLDAELKRGETVMKRADDVRRLASPFCNALTAIARGRRPRSRWGRDRGRRRAPDDMPVYADARRSGLDDDPATAI